MEGTKSQNAKRTNSHRKDSRENQSKTVPPERSSEEHSKEDEKWQVVQNPIIRLYGNVFKQWQNASIKSILQRIQTHGQAKSTENAGERGAEKTIGLRVVAKSGLGKWFAERWVDIGTKNKDGSYADCGRKSAKGDSKRKYPKCVPASKAKSMTSKEKASAVRRKRSASNTGKKPTNVATFKTKKKTAKSTTRKKSS